MRAPEFILGVFGGVGAALYLSVLSYYVFIYLVPCCDVRDDFQMKTMIGSSLPPLVCMRAHVLFMLFAFVAYNGVQHVLTI